MPEPVEGAPEAPATAPASESTPAPESGKPEWLTPEVEAWANQRIAGVQSGYQSQVNAAQEQARAAAVQAAELERRLNLSQMTEEEREQQALTDADAFVEALEEKARFIDMIDSGMSVEDVMLLRQAASASTADELLALLKGQSAQPEPAAQVPPTDPNNPPASPPAASEGSFLGSQGQSYSKEMRREILERLSAGGATMADLFKGR